MSEVGVTNRVCAHCQLPTPPFELSFTSLSFPFCSIHQARSKLFPVDLALSVDCQHEHVRHMSINHPWKASRNFHSILQDNMARRSVMLGNREPSSKLTKT